MKSDSGKLKVLGEELKLMRLSDNYRSRAVRGSTAITRPHAIVMNNSI